LPSFPRALLASQLHEIARDEAVVGTGSIKKATEFLGRSLVDRLEEKGFYIWTDIVHG
jgi:hypothetical protein